ncbi:hypothetical protein N8T08_010310 [Aspergillus melleus]|uniref:Uncharacterized protein n=1 Tax=Aspergillus melleus TaxID=138277 RepID=A0ACC3ARX5_9EURO|nr:hypothetical protein N8T08_010310 [Aspergillus melleus]
MGSVKEEQEESHGAASHGATLSPLRLNIMVFGLWISLFLSALDSTIISTAVFDISNSFDSTSQSGWIVTSYLLTYNAFVLLLAKLSDIVGLKFLIIGSNAVFLIFSVACGVARTMDQLIVFRALQGIGASGLYCLVFIAILRLISVENAGFYSGIISSVFAISNLLGPILGGVIVDHTTWRWIFYINIPISAIAIFILFCAMPASGEFKFNRETLARLDFIGSFLSICWLIPLLFALQEGGSHYPWSSKEIIGSLVGGVVALLTFIAYETWIQRLNSTREPVFPVRFLGDPMQGLLLLSVLLTGFAFYTSIILLPQRFQAVNGVSASRAGVLLLTLTLCLPFFSLVAGMILSKKPEMTFSLFLFGSVLILTSTACLSDLPVEKAMSDSQYGFQVLMGAGLGVISTTQYIGLKMVFLPSDIAAGTGAMNMLRAMGGCIGLAICAAMLSSELNSVLPTILSPELVDVATESLREGNGLSASDLALVREVYGKGYDSGYQVMIAFAGANVIVASLLILATYRRGGVDKMVEAARASETGT